MAEYHPDRDALEYFARGEVLAETEHWILEHLRSGCAICQRTVDSLLPGLSELPRLPSVPPPSAPPSSAPPSSAPPPASPPSQTLPAPPAHLGWPVAALPSPTTPATPANTATILPRFDPARRAALAYGTAPRPAAASPLAGPRFDVASTTHGRGDRDRLADAPALPDAPVTGSHPEAVPGALPGALPDVDLAAAARTFGASPSSNPNPETTTAAAAAAEIEAFDRIFAKLEQRLAMIDSERAAAPRLLAELLQRPPAERNALVHASRRFQTLALCDLLLDRSFEAAGRDLAAAVDLAGLGIAVADHLDVRYYGSAVVHDMMARAWAYLGNARRLAADLPGAEQALAFAESLAEDGSADPLEEARLLDLKASLLGDQGWFEEAADLLETVIEIYDDIKDLHRKGCALIGKGIYLGCSGRPQQAVELIPQGLALLGREIEPSLELAARHELAWSLNECGRCEQASQQLESCRQSLRAAGGDGWIELRLEWLEGRIAQRAGLPAEAEHRLGSLLQRCMAGGLGYEAALVMLDLATLYLQEGKRGEIRRLADETLPFFLGLDIHRQAVAALVAFHQAAADDRVTASLVRDIAAYLQRARKNPRLSFQVAA